MTTTTTTARGITTVASASRPECHGASHVHVASLSDSCTCATCRDLRRQGKTVPGKACPTFTSPRAQKRDEILAFWEAQGVAQYRTGGTGGGGAWFVRDMVNPERAGEWLPLARHGEDRRSDRGEFSHIIASAASGAWCACNLLPENGASNAGRDGDIVTLSAGARALLAAWPAYWREHYARKASLARL